MTAISEHRMQVGDLQIFYKKMGNGRPLILLHGGWATGTLNWSNHYQALSEKFEVYSPDHRGHGKTNNPTGKFCSYGNLAWEIISFIEGLNLRQKPIIIGHSSGALISLHISIFQPDLLAAQVLIGIHRRIGISACFKQGMENFFHTNDYRNPPAKLDYILRNPLWSLALWHAHKTPWFTLLRQAWPMWIKPLRLTDEDFKKIEIPTLMVHGDNDEFGSLDDARDLHSVIPDAQLETITGADHMFVISQAKRLRTIILPFIEKK